MSKDIYIVTSGSYSDYHIEAVFSNETEANAWAKKYGDAKCSYGDHANVEKWGLDSRIGEVPKKTFRCTIALESGEILQAWDYGPDMIAKGARSKAVEEHRAGSHDAATSTSYVSEKHAMKLAVEYRQKWLRERK